MFNRRPDLFGIDLVAGQGFDVAKTAGAVRQQDLPEFLAVDHDGTGITIEFPFVGGSHVGVAGEFEIRQRGRRSGSRR